MKRHILKIERRDRRKRGIRRGLMGGPDRPRLTVFRSNRHIYAQLIDDLTGRTIASCSTNDKDVTVPFGSNCSAAAVVGKQLAESAKKAGIETVVMDRNGFRYHGRIKALADAAREGGLKF
jgi:large subunit ribosomal protein L18